MVGMALVALLAAGPKVPPKQPQKTQLKVQVKPDTAVLYVDGKKVKSASGGKTLDLAPGTHRLRVVNRGDERTETVVLKKGEVKVWQWAFEDDRRDSGRSPSSEAPEASAEAGSSVGEEFSDPDLPSR